MKNLIMISVIAAFMLLGLVGSSYSSCGICAVKNAEAATVKDDSGGVVNSVCPVLGGKIESDTPYTVEYKGKKIGLCCPVCIKEFNANPDKYMAVVEKELKNKGK